MKFMHFFAERLKNPRKIKTALNYPHTGNWLKTQALLTTLLCSIATSTTQAAYNGPYSSFSAAPFSETIFTPQPIYTISGTTIEEEDPLIFAYTSSLGDGLILIYTGGPSVNCGTFGDDSIAATPPPSADTLLGSIALDDGTRWPLGVDNNAIASTPTACLSASNDGNYYMSLATPSLSRAETIISPALKPDEGIEVSCDSSETYRACYEKARLAYNAASCNGGGPGSCGTSLMTAEQSLSTDLIPGLGFMRDSQDAAADLTDAVGVMEPVTLVLKGRQQSSEAVFDFTISDNALPNGTSDGLSTDVSTIVLNTNGSGDYRRISWHLSGGSIISDATGVYNESENTLTFSSLGISIANGNSQTFTLTASIDPNDFNSFSHDDIFQFSVDGDTDLTLDPSKTQMRETAPVNATMNISIKGCKKKHKNHGHYKRHKCHKRGHKHAKRWHLHPHRYHRINSYHRHHYWRHH